MSRELSLRDVSSGNPNYYREIFILTYNIKQTSTNNHNAMENNEFTFFHSYFKSIYFKSILGLILNNYNYKNAIQKTQISYLRDDLMSSLSKTSSTGICVGNRNIDVSFQIS